MQMQTRLERWTPVESPNTDTPEHHLTRYSSETEPSQDGGQRRPNGAGLCPGSPVHSPITDQQHRGHKYDQKPMNAGEWVARLAIENPIWPKMISRFNSFTSTPEPVHRTCR